MTKLPTVITKQGLPVCCWLCCWDILSQHNFWWWGGTSLETWLCCLRSLERRAWKLYDIIYDMEKVDREICFQTYTARQPNWFWLTWNQNFTSLNSLVGKEVLKTAAFEMICPHSLFLSSAINKLSCMEINNLPSRLFRPQFWRFDPIIPIFFFLQFSM